MRQYTWVMCAVFEGYERGELSDGNFYDVVGVANVHPLKYFFILLVVCPELSDSVV